MFKYIPNILSFFRFLLIPIIVYFIFTNNYLLAIVMFTISALTDIIDGFIARKFNLVSNLGKLLDPLADKCTQISIIAALVINDIIEVWILVIIALKELIMIAGASFLYGKNVVVHSKWYGKLATTILYLAIVSSLLLKQFNASSEILSNIDLILYCIALTCTVFALIMYVKTMYTKGFINKDDLNRAVTIDRRN